MLKIVEAAQKSREGEFHRCVEWHDKQSKILKWFCIFCEQEMQQFWSCRDKKIAFFLGVICKNLNCHFHLLCTVINIFSDWKGYVALGGHKEQKKTTVSLSFFSKISNFAHAHFCAHFARELVYGFWLVWRGSRCPRENSAVCKRHVSQPFARRKKTLEKGNFTTFVLDCKYFSASIRDNKLQEQVRNVVCVFLETDDLRHLCDFERSIWLQIEHAAQRDLFFFFKTSLCFDWCLIFWNSMLLILFSWS